MRTLDGNKRKRATPGKIVAVWCAPIVIVLLLIELANAQKLVTPGYLFNSDPTCREINGQFYLFTTQDPFTVQLQTNNHDYWGMYAYHALSTTDFDHWVDHGSILTSRDVAWAPGRSLWDGDAGIPANGEFYAYAPFRMTPYRKTNGDVFDVGVFSANAITGPYREMSGGPMKDADGKPLEALSPMVVKADDGASYLIWGSGDTRKHEVTMARLKDNMTQFAEQPRKLSVPEKDACGNLEYFESPVLFKHGSKWYLTFVAYKSDRGAGCERKGAYVDYTVADSMFGPFDGPVHRLIYPSAGGEESVQQGICQYRGNWYMAYHLPYDDLVPYPDRDHHRQVAITSLRFNADGTLVPVNPDRDPGVGTPGVLVLTLDAFAPRREAAEFQVRTKAGAEPGLSGEYQLKMKDGGYLQFHAVDFGTGGARTFHAEVSSEVGTVHDASLEVRLDNPAGKLIASIPIHATGGRTAYRILSAHLQAPVHGVHDVCLVARGDGANAAGYLFNITWFNFAK